MTTPIPPARPTFQYQTSPHPCVDNDRGKGCGAGPGEPCVIRPGAGSGLRVGKQRATLHFHRPRVSGVDLHTVATVVEQPPPVANDHPAVVDLVVAEMQARKVEGIRRYGVPLQPFNGRNADQDAFEEALDLTFYLRQALEERRTLAPLLDELVLAAYEVIFTASLTPEDVEVAKPAAVTRLSGALGRYAQAHARTGLPPIPDANEGYVHRK
jgi:hypothetical protein